MLRLKFFDDQGVERYGERIVSVRLNLRDCTALQTELLEALIEQDRVPVEALIVYEIVS